MAKVLDVAKYIIYLSNESGTTAVSPSKLQKLLYYAQGFSLKYHNKVLFKTDIYALESGPVVKPIYYLYRKYNFSPIPKSNLHMENTMLDDTEKHIIRQVFSNYGSLDGKFLEELTHQEPPLLFTEKNKVINIQLISSYFKGNYNW